MIASIAISLLVTWIVEVIVSYLLGVRKRRDFGWILLANLYTNPIVVCLTNVSMMTGSRWAVIICVGILEIGALWMEEMIFARYLSCGNRAFRLSLMNNVCSFTIGILLFLRGKL